MAHQIYDAPRTGSPEEPGRDAAKPTSAGAPAGWPAPDPSPLEDGRPVVPAFPLDALPQPWREWVSDTACGACAPVDYVAQAVLGAVAGLCGAGVAATRLWRDYFRPHGRAVLDRCAPSDFERQVRRVVRWLKKAGAKAETTREEVRRHALGKTVNAGQTDLVLGRLWSAGIVRPAAHDSLPQGRASSATLGGQPWQGTSGVAEIAENKFYVA